MKIINLSGKSKDDTFKFESVKDRPLESVVFPNMLPRQMQTGTMRGVQAVGTGPKIDSVNNRFTVGDVEGQVVGMGKIPGSDTELGFFTTDDTGRVVMKIVLQTISGYDPNNNYNNNVQIIKLSNGEYGAAFAKDGEDLVDGLGS